jgi:hypothetical protein
MPKTKKLFDWEVYTDSGDLFDVLTMTRDQAKQYKKEFPDMIIKEISYHDGEDDTRDGSSTKKRGIYSVRVPRRRK